MVLYVNITRGDVVVVLCCVVCRVLCMLCEGIVECQVAVSPYHRAATIFTWLLQITSQGLIGSALSESYTLIGCPMGTIIGKVRKSWKQTKEISAGLCECLNPLYPKSAIVSLSN